MKTTRNTLIAAAVLGLMGSASMAAITQADVTASLQGQGFTDINFANESGDAMVVHATRNGAPVTIVYDRDSGDVRTVSAKGGEAMQDDGDMPGQSDDHRQDGKRGDKADDHTDAAHDDMSDDADDATDDVADDASDDSSDDPAGDDASDDSADDADDSADDDSADGPDDDGADDSTS